jgi:hypothetical protein
LTLASLAACVTSVGLYAIHRWVQAAWISPPDPAATIVSSTHAGYFWRVWTVSYAGVMVGFLAFAAARAHEARVARGLVVALSVSVALLVAQGIFVP